MLSSSKGRAMYRFLGFLVVVFAAAQLSADCYFWEEEEEECCPGYFISIEGHYDWIDSTKFKESSLAGQNLSFHKGEISLTYIQFLSECHGFALGVGYESTYLGWRGNPYFNQREFQDVVLSVDGFIDHFRGWDWKAGVAGHFDIDHFHLYDDSRYHFRLWGRYDFCNCYLPDLGVHIGFIGLVGINDETIYPIVGVDFSPWCDWKLNLIFPLDMSLSYYVNDCWSISLAGKLWETRHRVGKEETLSKGIFEYRNIGIELGTHYEYGKCFSAGVHVGSTVGGGKVRISDKHDANVTYNHLKEAFYFGGELLIRF